MLPRKIQPGRTTAHDLAIGTARQLLAVAFTLLALLPVASYAAGFQPNASGQVVMEAENFDANIPRNGRSWTPSFQPGFSGASAIQVAPDNGLTVNSSLNATAPQVNYTVDLDQSGRYFVWVRGVGPNWNGDSIWIGANSDSSAAVKLTIPKGAFGWVRSSRITFPSSGEQTLSVWMREDGSTIDKLLLTRDGTDTVSGVGPPESSRDGSTNPPVLSAPGFSPNGGSFVDSVTVTLSNSNPSASIYYTLDGSTPTSSSQPYSPGGFILTSTTTVRAIAILAGYADSPVVSAAFNITPAGGGGGSGAFQPDASGQVVIEAEHPDNSIDRGGRSWMQNFFSGFSGDGTMQAGPDSGTTVNSNLNSNSPQLDYPIEFSQSGRYHVWVRGVGPGWNSDSVWVGLNSNSASAALLTVPKGGLDWAGSVRVNVPSAGVHSLSIWMREDGVIIDKVVLARSSGATPTGLGPNESPRGDGGGSPPSTLPAPTFLPNGGTFVDSVTVSLSNSNSSANLYYTLDGTTPSAFSSRYTGPFELTSTATVRAIALLSGYQDSQIVSASFTITDGGGGGGGSPPEGAPNVLVFLADDMGWGDTTLYNSQSLIPTPNIDRLASNGMYFTDAHTSAAKCAPSRYSAITGNYQWRGEEPWGAWNYRGGSQLRPGQWSLGNVLQQAGYETAFIGKLHLGAHFYAKNSNSFAKSRDPEDVVDFSRRFREGPLDYGFDYAFMLLRGIQNSPYAYFRNDRLVGNANDMILWERGGHSGSVIDNPGLGLPDYHSREVGEDFAQEAIDFIDRHHRDNLASGQNTPFFLYYNSQSAHGPYTPPSTLLGQPVRNQTITFHTDMLYEIDVVLGLLVEALEQRGLDDNTLIVFTSDNGGLTKELEQGHDSVGGLRGQKGQIWEGGHRVPFVARWGDGSSGGSHIPPGTVRHQLVGVQDLMATVAALTGQTLPQDQGMDSFDILPVLRGQRSDSSPVRDHIIMQADRGDYFWAYREGSWKLILDDASTPRGLFNLANDINETNDLLNNANQAQRVSDMLSRYLQRRGANRTAP